VTGRPTGWRRPAGVASLASGWVPLVGIPTERAVILVALVVGAAGGAVALALLPSLPAEDALPLLVLLGLVLVTRLQTLPLLEHSSFSVSVVPVLAGGMLLGAPGAVVLSLVSGLIHGLVRRLPWYKIVFNCGNYTLAAAAAATVFRALGPSLESEDLPPLLGAGVLAGMTHYLHTFVVAVAIAAERRTAALATWSEHFAWLWPQYGVLGVLALFLALVQRQFGAVGAVVFVIPPLMMLYVAKQYMDRTASHLSELRALNEELTGEIARRAAAEEENARLARAAGRAGALAEQSRLKSRFISVASHEMRTPLTGIINATALALADTEASDPRHQLLTVAQSCANQLARLFEDLLDTSRIEAGQVTLHVATVDLEAAVLAVIEELQPGAPRHALAAEVAPEAAWARVDPDKLRQMLTNLATNAIKYSPNGGEVRLSTRPGPTPERVEILVADRGVGIAAAEMEQIFDPYRRGTSAVTRRVRGAGLGLYIVRSLAELHGGSVQVESEVGRGSTFRLVLPSPHGGEQ
jgi:signal transduction histidine kinase